AGLGTGIIGPGLGIVWRLVFDGQLPVLSLLVHREGSLRWILPVSRQLHALRQLLRVGLARHNLRQLREVVLGELSGPTGIRLVVFRELFGAFQETRIGERLLDGEVTKSWVDLRSLLLEVVPKQLL